MQTEPVKPRYSTTTGAADASVNQENLALQAPAPPLLKTIVFVGGICVMALQMTASRLVQPFFGSSQLIWANLIGFTMVCLALGYFIGGRLGDRYPRAATLYLIISIASVASALIALLANPVLGFTRELSFNLPAGQFIGSLLGIFLLFFVPMTLYGCVSPFATRLLLRNVSGAGKTAGGVSSLSTIGSIFGTFIPVFVIIPTVGARATILLAAGIMLVFAIIGLALTGWGRKDAPLANSEVVRPTEADEPVQSQTDDAPLATPFLLPIVLVCGLSVMAVEMGASRLIQPFFGDSLLIWAFLIGFVIVYLAIGYNLGGRLADRNPRPAFLYTLTGCAAAAMALVPIISTPLFSFAQDAFRTINGGIFFAALIGVILLLAAPIILLGCVSPFAIRLLMRNRANAGKTAGKVSSLSTFGSIFGSFLPVLLFIPLIGTRNTFFFFSAVLLFFSAVGLFMVAQKQRATIFGGVLVAVAAVSLVFNFGIKTAPYGVLLYEDESSYNYIQVVKRDARYGPEQNGQIDLVLNEGRAIHSIYNPNKLLTGGPWDYYMLAPNFNPGFKSSDFKSMMMIGLGAGTVPKQLTKAYGNGVQVDGIEIDPQIIDVGRKYFEMNEPNLNAIAQDGRYGLLASGKKYDLIGMDAYKQPYIPFHLTTKEFFQEVRNQLTPGGVAVVNAGSPAVNGKVDYRLAESLAQTMKQVFPNVYMINLLNISGYYNTMVIATNQPSTIAGFKESLTRNADNTIVSQVAAKMNVDRDVREWNGEYQSRTAPIIFTDDLAPVERIIDQVIIDYVVEGGK
jgi:spermidine synthase